MSFVSALRVMMGTMKKYKQSAKSFDKIEEQDGQDQV